MATKLGEKTIRRTRTPIILQLFGSAFFLKANKNYFGAPIEINIDMKINNSLSKRILLSIIFSLCISPTVVAQTQLGNDINGVAAGDLAGSTVSLSADGNRLAIGARRNNDSGLDSGHVRVFQWSGTSWIQLGADIDGEAAGDSFGGRVSLSADGNRLAVGGRGNDDNGNDSGHVRVFQWSGTAWTQIGADIDGEAAWDESGNSVSLSPDGSRVAIAALWSDGNGENSGHVRVYQWSGDSWTQLGSDIDGEGFENQWGSSVSLSYDGGRLAIGARYYDENAMDSGHVRVYQWSGSAWTQFATGINGEEERDRCGQSVSLSSDGNRLAIGCPSSSGYERNSGSVRIFQWSDDSWIQLGAEIVGEAVGDGFGESVSLSQNGSRLAIGTASNDGNGRSSGHGRVYQWSGETWIQLGVDIDGEAAGDSSGAVSLSLDGNRLAVGAQANDGNGENSGHVRAFDFSMFNVFKINAGLNDAWYYPETSGQGFLITVFPDLNLVSLAWFTYDTELPAEDAPSNLGDPGHRWLSGLGVIDGNQVNMNIEMTSGGLFDTATVIERTDPPGSDGTITLTFDNCNSGTVEYDIASINRQGTVPIQRVAGDNIVLCEALKAD